MATGKENKKLSPYQEEVLKCAKQIKEYKTIAEANIVAILYKKPDLIFDYTLQLEDFSENTWRVYWQIANDIIVVEKKSVLDDMTVGLYLEKHLKLKKEYENYGGYETIDKAKEYVNVNNIDGYVKELYKWNTVLEMLKNGFPVQNRIKEFCDMSLDSIYEEYEAMLNHIFINAEDDEYQFVGEASDGEMALPLIQKLKPDVLLTDIKMPFMDGLSLSRIVHQEFPDMKIIIISGYDDFEYARQAIVVGVEQYLLKPITRANLQKVLAELKTKIETEREQRNYQEKYQNETRAYEQFSRTNFFVKVFEGRMAVQDIYEEAAKLSLKINAPCYNLLMFSLTEKRGGENSGFESETFARKREEILRYFVRYPEHLVFRWNVNTYGVLIKGNPEQMKELTARSLENLERICKPAEDDFDWYAAVGEPVERLSMLAECYGKVNHLFAYRFLLPTVHIFTSEVTDNYMPLEASGKIGDIDYAKIEPELIKDFLQQGSRAEIAEFVDGWMHSIQEALKSRLFQNYLVFHIHFVTMAYVESIGYDKKQFLELLGEEQIQEMNLGIEELSLYICNILEKAMELRDRESDNRGRKVLKKALEYIEQNYMQETFSLNVVAGEIGVSANYFSAIFSQAMDVTFVEYVTQKRMEKARKLLRQTEKPSGEIALEVGYKDPHYFSFVFKKTQGCTPREYRSAAKD